MVDSTIEPGPRLQDADQIFMRVPFNWPFKNALTALAGGGQTGATQLVSGGNKIAVCATIADSAQLPSALAGKICIVTNAGAQSCTIYGKSGRTDTINATAGATGLALAAGVSALFFCPQDTFWYRILSA